MRNKEFLFFLNNKEKKLGRGQFYDNYKKTSIWMQNERTKRGVVDKNMRLRKLIGVLWIRHQDQAMKNEIQRSINIIL